MQTDANELKNIKDGLPALSPRLRTAALEMAKLGRFPADIGTDHALVPSYLVLSGLADRAVAADIALGPLLRAKETIDFYQLQEKIALHHANGLEKIEEFGPDCILIAGMGGETIAEILEASSYPLNRRCGILLQPMTKAALLRRRLNSNGYRVLQEFLVREGKRLYPLFSVRFTEEREAYSFAEYEIGKLERHVDSALVSAYINQRIQVLSKKFRGLRSAKKENIAQLEMLSQTLHELEKMRVDLS